MLRGGGGGKCVPASFPCLGRRRGRDQAAAAAAEQELDPVLLVSGMGGSILNARSKKKKKKSEIRVWVRILLANFEFKKKLWSLYDPGTGYTTSLDPDVEIVVPEDDYGLYAIDNLDPSWWAKFFNLAEVQHFHDVIDMLIGCGYEKGISLFGYGYDFRQSNRIDKSMDGLKAKLETAYKSSGGKKVNLVSHSMGGLLIRCFLSLNHDIFERYVNKWICLGCPFQGAPGCINDSLLTGLQFVYGFESFFFVSRWTMHQLVVECPSIYEMLANPYFEWTKGPLMKVWRKQSNDKEDTSVNLEEYDTLNSIALFEEALRDNEIEFNGKSVHIPFNSAIFKWAAETRQILNKAQLPESVSFYNIYGTSIGTPHDVCYGSETSPIGDLSEVCHTVPEYTYVDGDGTVPSESAKADGFNAKARFAVNASHRGMLRDRNVLELLKECLGVSETSEAQTAAATAKTTTTSTVAAAKVYDSCFLEG